MIAVANNYGIYLTARSQEISSTDQGITGRDLLTRLFSSLNMPILFSGLTTIAGILGLLAHSIIPARQVGVLASIGVTVALMLSLLLIPSLIYQYGTYSGKGMIHNQGNGLITRIMSSLSKFVIDHSKGILIFIFVITLALSAGILFVRIDTNQENYFPEKHPVKHTSEIINKKFGGSQTISVMLSGDILDPEVMRSIDNMTETLEKENGVGRVFSISVAVREMSKAIFNKDEAGYNSIPHTRDGIAQMFELYYMSGDRDDFRQLVNTDNTRAHILIKLSDASNSNIDNIKLKINNIAKSIPAKINTGGYAIIMDDFAGKIINGQASSLIIALVTVIILLSIIFRSFSGGLIGSIPLAVSIIVVFGLMGVTGIALDAATALLSSIMIGVGVDFTIQYIWCFSMFFNNGEGYIDSTRKAMNTIGRSIIVNAVSVMAGFSVLMFSGFISIRFFGFLVFISIGTCLIGAIILIPAFILRFKPSFVEKITVLNRNSRHENNSDNNIVAGDDLSGDSSVA
jgi:predicted RND superfamily exporter protein